MCEKEKDLILNTYLQHGAIRSPLNLSISQ